MTMGEVIFCTTNDGSVGLYNDNVKDIYHSSYGAYKESVEKFIEASGFREFINNHDSVRVLDICYGIGYNTKTALNEILNLNKTLTAHFDCLEYDKDLINISPMLKNQKIDNRVNEFIIKNANLDSNYTTWKTLKYFYKTCGLRQIKWSNMLLRKPGIQNKGGLSHLVSQINSFLHNIYYNYISFSMKKGQKSSNLSKTSLRFYSDDARKAILELSDKYNFIFLDAFTPKKLPTLWSYEFFKELYRLLDANGILVTYSSSAAVRAAMLKAGFYVGKSLGCDGKIIGTVAAKDESLIKYKLNDFETKLLETTAGIYYRDENLDAAPEKMIARREEEAKSSNRMTSSRFKKDYAKRI